MMQESCAPGWLNQLILMDSSKHKDRASLICDLASRIGYAMFSYRADILCADIVLKAIEAVDSCHRRICWKSRAVRPPVVSFSNERVCRACKED